MNYIRFEEYTLGGNWSEVEKMYDQFPEAHTAKITNSVGKKSICVGTALHVAIELNEEEIVKKLLQIITKHKHETNDPLKIKNESGDTPLHVAASRGFVKLCRLIIGEYKERIELVRVKNKDGETPLFLAALNWRKRTFAYLSHITRNSVTAYDLTRKNGDTILHCAIKMKCFDLAVIIMDYYDFLGTLSNEDGITPLKVLATMPSAFSSGSRLPWWKQIAYHSILVEPLNVERMMKKLEDEIEPPSLSKEKFPMNYATFSEFFRLCQKLALSIGFVKNKKPRKRGQQQQQDSSEQDDADPENQQTKEITNQNASLPTDYFHFGTENPQTKEEEDNWNHYKNDIENPPIREITNQNGSLPPNYATCNLFIKLAFVDFLGFTRVVDLKELSKTKQQHQWSYQLLVALLKRPYTAFTGRGGNPQDKPIDDEIYNILGGMEGNDCEGPSTPPPPQTEGNVWLVAVKNRQPLVIETQKMTLTAVDGKEVVFNDLVRAPNYEDDLLHLAALALGTNKSDKAEDLNETAFLLAAGNGIVEMVRMILDKIPSAIHNTNAKKENVLLVAVKNRLPRVVEDLKKRLITVEKSRDVWRNLVRAANDDDNTMLHLAANALGEDQPGQIAVSALQMMWDIKWYEYIKSLVPPHYELLANKDHKTAEQIFEVQHKELIKECGEWLKDTSESCSAVAALIASVCFATAYTAPGGNSEGGTSPFLGTTAYNAFAICSLIGLCFSVTALTLFLSIRIPRKEVEYFRKSLPRKLIAALSSLFIAIVAMFLSFCFGHYFLLNKEFGKSILVPLYAATALPVIFLALGQLPLYHNLLMQHSFTT